VFEDEQMHGKHTPQAAELPLSHSAGTNVARHTEGVPVRNALTMAGVHGDGRPARQQGVVMYTNRPPLNRAQARFLARVERRATKRKK
jgi:hypothetical protein